MVISSNHNFLVLKFKHSAIFLHIWNVFLVFSICSCDNNTQEINHINNENPQPVGMASDLRMIYTDSMKISAILTSNKHIDFTNLTFKYSKQLNIQICQNISLSV